MGRARNAKDTVVSLCTCEPGIFCKKRYNGYRSYFSWYVKRYLISWRYYGESCNNCCSGVFLIRVLRTSVYCPVILISCVADVLLDTYFVKKHLILRRYLMNNNQYAQLLLAALLAAKRAGKVILEVYNSDFAIEHKDDESPLTLADKQSHESIVNALKQPMTANTLSFPLLSEEGNDIPYNERKRWEYFWLVDPLDGTKEFIKRNGEFAVNIALIHRNRPVLGCIYIPVQDIFYFATVNLGAYKLVNGQNVAGDVSIKELLDASQKLPLSAGSKESAHRDSRHAIEKNIPLTVVGSRSHATKELSEFVDKIKEKCGEVEFLSAGSSLKFCLVAEGKADVYPRFGPTMEWDTAAGQAIIEQAEGRVLDIQTKEPLKYNKLSLLNPFFVVSGQRFLASQFEYFR